MPKQCFIADHLPRESIHFQSALSQHLSMSDANFGSIDLDSFAFVLRLKLDSLPTSANYTIMSQYDNSSAARRAYELRINTNGRVRVQNWTGGVCTTIDDIAKIMERLSFDNKQLLIKEYEEENHGVLQKVASGEFLSDTERKLVACTISRTNWIASTNTITDLNCHEILAHCDPNNVTATNRLKLWLDGSLETPAGSSFGFKGQVNNSSEDIRVGSRDGNQYFDGKIYELAFFSGSLPDITDIRHSDGTPKDLRDLVGLKSHLRVDCGDVTEDEKLITNWTNNNGALASNEICDGPIP